MLLTKRAYQCTIFQNLSALMKVHPLSHAIFETARPGLFKFCIAVQCHERLLICSFLAQVSYTLDKNSLSK